jgi:hypothetical protein
LPNNDDKYYFERPGDLFIRPLNVKVRATFSSSGAVVTPSSTRRQSHPGVAITGSGGTYSVTGLPTGSDYHVKAVELNPGTGTKTVCIANVSAFDASAGTMTILTRNCTSGAVAAPADSTELFLALDVETGAPS